MIVAKNDEAKRSKIWRVVTVVSSILIVVIAVYLLTKMFTTNPLEGTWEGEDGNFILSIKGNNSLTVEVQDLAEDVDSDIKMDYVLDKDEKTVTIKMNESEVEKAVKRSDGVLTEETLENALSSVTTTFDYSVDRDTLTLTEREYGEQMTFTKK